MAPKHVTRTLTQNDAVTMWQPQVTESSQPPAKWVAGTMQGCTSNRWRTHSELGTSLASARGHSVQFSSVQLLSRVRLFATPWIPARQGSLSITNSQSSLKLMSIESVMPSSHLILCRPLLHLPPIPPSIRVFSNESTLRMRWPKYWSFSSSISPSKEHPGLISFRMDLLALLLAELKQTDTLRKDFFNWNSLCIKKYFYC